MVFKFVFIIVENRIAMNVKKSKYYECFENKDNRTSEIEENYDIFFVLK